MSGLRERQQWKSFFVPIFYRDKKNWERMARPCLFRAGSRPKKKKEISACIAMTQNQINFM